MPRIHFARRTEWNLAPNRLSLALAQHRAGGRPLVDLTASNPTQCGFGYDGTAILQALSQRESLLYEPQPLGLEAARRSISGYYAERGDRVAPSHLLLTTSTSEAYSFVFRLLCNPADELLAPVPSYPLFSFLADIQDVRLVHYPLSFDSEWAIDFPALERALSPRTRGIIVVHPNNPTGHYCRREEIARLSTLAASRGIALIADEVFWDFSLREVRAPSFAGNAETLTFTLSGISKIAGLPQMKAAWLAVSGPDAERSAALERLAIIADTYLSMNAPVQHALPVFLERRRAFHEQLIARVRRNLAELDRRLAVQKLCSRLPVEGGWYAVLRVPATRPDEDTAIELLERYSAYVHPGHFYDFPADGYLVVSLITPESDFAEGIQRIASFFSL